MTTDQPIKEEPESPPDLEELLVEVKSEKLEAQLRAWSVDFEKYRVGAEQAGAEVRAEFEQRAPLLRAKMTQAQARLHELKKAGSDASRDMLKDIDAAWDDLRKAFEDVAAKLK